MRMSKLPTTIACGLLIAIFFVAIQSPQRQAATAQQQVEQLGKALSVIEQDSSKLTIDALQELNQSIGQLSELIANQSKEIQSIEQCQQADAEEFRAKLVALESKETASQTSEDCECNCAAELESLKARVAALEARCPPATATYPSASSVKSAGSTVVTTTATGGSTGTVVQSSYGSAGSTVARQEPRPPVVANTVVVQQQPRTPLRTAAAVVTAPIARAGHWTYPGEISSHLANDHGVSTAGMTRQQMLDLHDSLHEGTAVSVQSPAVNVQTFSPARPPLIQRPVQSYAPAVSNCPGGNCPTPAATRSTGWYLGKNLGRR